MKQWAKAISVDAIVIGCLVAGVWFGMEWARNIASFIIWSYSLLTLLLVFSGRRGQELLIAKLERHSVLFNYYVHATDIGFIILLAALGWFATAGVYLISKMAVEALQHEIIKAP